MDPRSIESTIVLVWRTGHPRQKLPPKENCAESGICIPVLGCVAQAAESSTVTPGANTSRAGVDADRPSRPALLTFLNSQALQKATACPDPLLFGIPITQRSRWHFAASSIADCEGGGTRQSARRTTRCLPARDGAELSSSRRVASTSRSVEVGPAARSRSGPRVSRSPGRSQVRPWVSSWAEPSRPPCLPSLPCLLGSLCCGLRRRLYLWHESPPFTALYFPSKSVGLRHTSFLIHCLLRHAYRYSCNTASPFSVSGL